MKPPPLGPLGPTDVIPEQLADEFARAARTFLHEGQSLARQANTMINRALAHGEAAELAESQAAEAEARADEHEPFAATALADRNAFNAATREAAEQWEAAKASRKLAADCLDDAATRNQRAKRYAIQAAACQRCTLHEANDLDRAILNSLFRGLVNDARTAGLIIPAE